MVYCNNIDQCFVHCHLSMINRKKTVFQRLYLFIYSGFRGGGGPTGGDPTVLGLLQTARYSDGLGLWSRPNI